MPTYYHLNDTPYDRPTDEADFDWIVTDYEIGDYSGSGEAVGLHRDGKLYDTGLGHCSCYDPFDGKLAPARAVGMTPEEYLADLDDAVGTTPRLKRKVAELLGVVELKDAK